MQVEQPKFTVVATHNGYEVRRFTENLVRAEVSSSDWPDTPTGDAKFGNQVHDTDNTRATLSLGTMR